MIPSTDLAIYAMLVSQMRAAQKALTPGAPMALREVAKQLEREVDDATTLHLMPIIPELPPHEQ